MQQDPYAWSNALSLTTGCCFQSNSIARVLSQIPQMNGFVLKFCTKKVFKYISVSLCLSSESTTRPCVRFTHNLKTHPSSVHHIIKMDSTAVTFHLQSRITPCAWFHLGVRPWLHLTALTTVSTGTVSTERADTGARTLTREPLTLTTLVMLGQLSFR